MPLTVKRLGNVIGAELLGLDLSRPLSDATVAEVRRAWLDNLVLVIRGQDITPAQHVAFSERLGEPERGNALSHYNHPEHPEILMITNHTINGKPSETRNTGRQWHSDLSYTLRPPMGSILHAREIPEAGGDTMFSNMYAAYETLSPAMQAFLEPLQAVHDFMNSKDMARRDPATVEAMKQRTPPVAQPVVRVHPETGRKALYVHEAATMSIEGLAPEESRAILDFLFRHCETHEHIYRHRWQLHDIVMWDNRCVSHIALFDYSHSSPRHMLRTTLIGTPSGSVRSRGTPAELRAVAAG